MKPLKELIRANIWALKPYSSARDEYNSQEASVFLDANENPYNAPTNRYPDPLQRKLKKDVATIKGVPAENIFLGNGSDEAIDIPFRIFCNPGVDNVVSIEPTYGMYRVCADINDVEYRPVLLNDRFDVEAEKVLAATDDHTKIIFLCSPNNPTGKCLNRDEIRKIIENFEGIVILDEAYSDFSSEKPFRTDILKYPNLIVLNTFSKAWGAAAIRLGMAFASTEIISFYNKVKYPYNVNQLTQEKALDLLKIRFNVDKWVKLLIEERGRLIAAFNLLPICEKVFPTDANFFLARMKNAPRIYEYLVEKGIIVRNRSSVTLCDNCLRITIGTPQENSQLLAALRNYKEA